MAPRLQRIFDEIEQQRISLIERLKAQQSETLTLHADGAWSVNQVLAHLITGERMALNYVLKKYNAVKEAGDSGVYEEMKMVALKVTQRLPFLKFKAPKVVVENTTNFDDSFENLCDEWETLRGQWRSFLEGVPPEYSRRKVYKHVVAGRLGLHHGLMFMREHVIHHLPQIRRRIGN